MSQLKWDRHWLHHARLSASQSKDPSTQVGAAIIRPDNSVAALGYNGFPRKMEDRLDWLSDRNEKYPRIIHAEINARDSMSERADHCTLYTWPFLTCDRCCVQMIQAGIIRVVAPIIAPDQASRWEETLIRARQYYEECGVFCEEIEFRTDPWKDDE